MTAWYNNMKSTKEQLDFPVPEYDKQPEKNFSTVIRSEEVEKWYSPALITASIIGQRSLSRETIQEVLNLYKQIEPDDYVSALIKFYSEGLSRYGDDWNYSDIVTVLYAAGELIKPKAYLEIGVRRGRSLAAVAATQPFCNIFGFDYWKRNYAGMETPGPEFVENEIKRTGYKGKIELISGNSHETVPAYLKAHPDLWFDLITVDGDHTAMGAADDLCNVLPRLKVGGAIVFDDISHPAHPDLNSLWDFYVNDSTRFSTWKYTDLGFGVGIAVRKG